jgi:hypothetical protein
MSNSPRHSCELSTKSSLTYAWRMQKIQETRCFHSILFAKQDQRSLTSSSSASLPPSSHPSFERAPAPPLLAFLSSSFFYSCPCFPHYNASILLRISHAFPDSGAYRSTNSDAPHARPSYWDERVFGTMVGWRCRQMLGRMCKYDKANNCGVVEIVLGTRRTLLC